MVVIGAGVRVGVIAVPVLVVRGIDIGRKVGVGGLQAVIDDADAHTAAAGAGGSGEIPNRLDVHIRPGDGAAGALEMPLISDERVIRQRPERVLGGEQDIRGSDLAEGAEIDHGIKRGERIHGAHDDPAGGVGRAVLDGEAVLYGEHFRGGGIELDAEVRRDDAAAVRRALLAGQIGHRENAARRAERSEPRRQGLLRGGRREADDGLLAIRIAQGGFIERERDRAGLAAEVEIPGFLGVDPRHRRVAGRLRDPDRARRRLGRKDCRSGFRRRRKWRGVNLYNPPAACENRYEGSGGEEGAVGNHEDGEDEGYCPACKERTGANR